MPKYPRLTFKEWILSAKVIKTGEEFDSLYKIGRILQICDRCGIPKNQQPCNPKHFQILQRYEYNQQLLRDVWQCALQLVK